MHGVFAWYNIGWQASRFNNQSKHERTLAEDLTEAIDELHADVILLSECGEVGCGLTESTWLPLLRRVVGPGFAIRHQGHYTSIVRLATVAVEQGPTLVGPLTSIREHEYRKCQHLRVRMKDSAAKPIDLYNVHSPSSKRHPLTASVRADILLWFAVNAGNRALIGGDLNSSKPSLDAGFKHLRDVHYCYEENHHHGDLVVAKGTAAESTECLIDSTSDAHRMCVVLVPLEPLPLSSPVPAGSAEKVAEKATRSGTKPSGSADDADEIESATNPAGSAEKPAGATPAGNQEVETPHSPTEAADWDSPVSSQQVHSSPEPASPSPAGSAEKPTEPALPLVDALFEEIGARMDAGEAERQVFGQLAEHLWKGTFVFRYCEGSVEQPRAAKMRLERMLRKATEVRETYQNRLFNMGELPDRDLLRDLGKDDTAKIHNAWMNDVGSWMTEEALAEYDELLREAGELDLEKGKGKQGGKSGRGKGSAGKPAKEDRTKGKLGKTGKGGKAARPAIPGPRQQAQQLKKQRFNKIISDISANKAFLFTFVRPPGLRTPDGILQLVQELTEVRSSPEYAEIVRVSSKKTEEVTELKRKRDSVRLAAKRGKREFDRDPRSRLGALWASGELERQRVEAEAAYGNRRTAGVAVLLQRW